MVRNVIVKFEFSNLSIEINERITLKIELSNLIRPLVQVIPGKNKRYKLLDSCASEINDYSKENIDLFTA